MSRHLLVLVLVILSFGSARAQKRSAVQPSETPSSDYRVPPQPTSQLIVDGEILGREVPSRPGEICVVCKRRIGTEGVVYLVKGQRFPMHVPACYEKFRGKPLSFLAALQPHGAFLGAGGESQGLSFGWFWGGLYVLLGLGFGALCAHRALSTGRSPAAWFGAGLALNVLAYLWLLTRPRRAIGAPWGVPEGLAKMPVTYAPQPCPNCQRMNHPAADRCADCGRKLQPAQSSEVGKAGLRSS
jgi:hypothetical protein